MDKVTITETTIPVRLRQRVENGAVTHYYFIFGQCATEQEIHIKAWSSDSMNAVFKKYDQLEKKE